MNVGGSWVVGRASVSISVLEHNSATVRNILIVLGRIIEQVNVDCKHKNDNSAILLF